MNGIDDQYINIGSAARSREGGRLGQSITATGLDRGSLFFRWRRDKPSGKPDLGICRQRGETGIGNYQFGKFRDRRRLFKSDPGRRRWRRRRWSHKGFGSRLGGIRSRRCFNWLFWLLRSVRSSRYGYHVRRGRLLGRRLRFRDAKDQAIIARSIGRLMDDHLGVLLFGSDLVYFIRSAGRDLRDFLQVIPDDALMGRLNRLIGKNGLSAHSPAGKPKQPEHNDRMQEQRDPQ
jgi:hypothetical protein